MRHSLRLKILAAFMLVISVTLGTVLIGIAAFFKDQILTGKQQELVQKGWELARQIQSISNGPGSLDQLNEYLSHADQYLGARIWVLDGSRQIVAMSGRRNMAGPRGPMAGGMFMSPMNNMRSLWAELDSVYAGHVLTKTMEQPFYEEKMVVVAVPIQSTGGTVSGAVLLNAPIIGINAFMERIYYYVAAGGLAALLIALLIVHRLTGAIARPLTAMEQAAELMSTGNYAIRIPIDSSDEVGRLGRAFNRLAQDLGDYMAEIAKTEKLRSDFVANVSHELRTPLTVMRSYTEALLDGTVDDSARAQKYLQTMHEETVRLERLAKDLLDLSRLQSETAPWTIEAIPLPAIADSVIHMLKQTAAVQNITLRLTVADHVPDIMGSGDRLTQLLLILLDNALKFTPAGGVIEVALSHSPNGVLLAVTDSGIGIPSQDLPYIWDRFYKADQSHSRANDGAGLGLAIARQIIERHNATVSVTSDPGHGTTFRITFPVAKNYILP